MRFYIVALALTVASALPTQNSPARGPKGVTMHDALTGFDLAQFAELQISERSDMPQSRLGVDIGGIIETVKGLFGGDDDDADATGDNSNANSDSTNSNSNSNGGSAAGGDSTSNANGNSVTIINNIPSHNENNADSQADATAENTNENTNSNVNVEERTLRGGVVRALKGTVVEGHNDRVIDLLDLGLDATAEEIWTYCLIQCERWTYCRSFDLVMNKMVCNLSKVGPYDEGVDTHEDENAVVGYATEN